MTANDYFLINSEKALDADKLKEVLHAEETLKDCSFYIGARLGTISPWSSKAGDILNNIGFTEAEATRVKLVIGKGCEACASGGSKIGTGYKGRMGVYEILKITKNIKDAILRKATTQELKDVAKRDNFRTMQDMGKELLLTGDLSFAEYQRILTMD